MADINANLYCNFKRCRNSIISSSCFITSCSHVLCNNHGHIDDSSLSKKCPVCNTNLDRQFDLVQINVNPTEEYKSMVLAGLSPSVILDIASRALAFWNFQQHIERTNQSLRITHLTTRVAQLQSSFETMSIKVKNDLQVEELKKETLQNEIKILTTRLQDASKCIFDKNRQLQILKQKCEDMRKETMASKAREEEVMQTQRESIFSQFMLQDHTRNADSHLMTPRFQRNHLPEQSAYRNCHYVKPSKSDFKFNPVTPSKYN